MGLYNQTVYIISESTKAIMSENSPYYRTKVLDGDREIRSIQNPERIIDNSCIINGSTLEGRRNAVKEQFRMNSKIPIPINVTKGIFMFPTASTRSKDCIWLSYYHVHNYDTRNHQTYITFVDGTGIFVNASLNTIDMQFKRTSHIIAQLNRPAFYGNENMYRMNTSSVFSTRFGRRNKFR